MNWNGLSGIDLGSIEEDTGSSTLSAGAHICRITDAELNKTKNRDWINSPQDSSYQGWV